MFEIMSKKSLDLNNIEIIFEGILKKSPPLKSKSLFNLIAKFSCAKEQEEKSSDVFQKRWRKRYFVLFKNMKNPSQTQLYYFKTKPIANSKSVGSINMDNFGSLTVDVGTKLGKPNVFTIQTVDDKANTRTYYLSAESYEMMNLWVEKIVSCLGLNQKNLSSTSPIIHSPLNSNVRTTPRTSQLHPSTPGNRTIPGRSTKPIVDLTRTPSNAQNTENSLTYYNMDRNFGNQTNETFVDSIFAEDDDIYKFPCEANQQHSYFNLEDELKTPNNVCQMFFGSDFNPESKPVNDKPKENAIVKVEEKIDKTRNGIAHDNLKDVDLIDIENDLDSDFNFELPSRIKNDDSSSTSSCCSSTNTNPSVKELITFNEIITVKESKPADPPQVPKRLTSSENPSIPSLRTSVPESTLPSIPPRNYETRNSNQINEAATVLNYLDATNLILNTKPQNNCLISFPRGTDSPSCSNNDVPLVSLDPKMFEDFTSTYDFVPNHNLEPVSSSASLISQKVKDIPKIEYSEINDARTEGLHKLNVRIHKHD